MHLLLHLGGCRLALLLLLYLLLSLLSHRRLLSWDRLAWSGIPGHVPRWFGAGLPRLLCGFGCSILAMPVAVAGDADACSGAQQRGDRAFRWHSRSDDGCALITLPGCLRLRLLRRFVRLRHTCRVLCIESFRRGSM
jgi:hypothetical protein